MIHFVDVQDRQCKTPLVMTHNPPGPNMWVCGAPVLPGRSHCLECKALLYYRPTHRELRGMDFKVGRPIQPLRPKGLACRSA